MKDFKIKFSSNFLTVLIVFLFSNLEIPFIFGATYIPDSEDLRCLKQFTRQLEQGHQPSPSLHPINPEIQVLYDYIWTHCEHLLPRNSVDTQVQFNRNGLEHTITKRRVINLPMDMDAAIRAEITQNQLRSLTMHRENFSEITNGEDPDSGFEGFRKYTITNPLVFVRLHTAEPANRFYELYGASLEEALRL